VNSRELNLNTSFQGQKEAQHLVIEISVNKHFLHQCRTDNMLVSQTLKASNKESLFDDTQTSLRLNKIVQATEQPASTVNGLALIQGRCRVTRRNQESAPKQDV